jgi:hypothetical protein
VPALRAKLVLLWLIVPLACAGFAWADDQPVSLSPDVLDKMYQSELGPQFSAVPLQKLRNVHDLIERYFAEPSPGVRTRFAAELDASGVPKSIIGKLARIRSNWTALAPGVYYISTKAGPLDVKYFLGIPAQYDVTKSWPLVIKLPAANAFLTQPPPDASAVTQIYTQWMGQELAAHPDAVVVMPLLNLDELWGPGPVGMNLVIQPMLDAANRANIDPSQVFLIGHSMAAQAVWNLAIHYPTYFAGINPMAGSARDAWQRIRMGNLGNIFTVVWADTSDDVINVDESRSLVAYLRRMDYAVDYTETRDLGHVPSAPIIEQEYEKVRSRPRDLYPKQVYLQSNNFDTIFNRADWVQIYQPLSPGQQAKVQFSRGSQGMYIYEQMFRVIAEISDPHTIKLTTRNVRLVRLYLNDQLVDLDHPITIVANGMTRYNAIVPQSAAEMLKDEQFLGRGWRYYSAVVDLDLSESATKPSTQPASHAPIDYIGPDGEHHVFVPGQGAGQ